MLTRRELEKIAVAGLALPRLVSAADSKVAGVRIGVQTYSYATFHGRSARPTQSMSSSKR